MITIKTIHKITAGLAIAVVFSSCFKDENSQGYEYMPDMYRSPAQEAYVDYGEVRTWKSNDSIKNTPSAKLPPLGTVPFSGANNADLQYSLPYKRLPSKAMIASHGLTSLEYNDGDYDASVADVSPMALTKSSVEDGKVLYNRFCDHCHGEKGAGDGKVSNNEAINPPANAFTKPEGQMFYSITYGKGVMGAHGSQVNQKERWQIINYIKSMNGAEVMPDPVEENFEEDYAMMQESFMNAFAESEDAGTPHEGHAHGMVSHTDSAHAAHGDAHDHAASMVSIELDHLEFNTGSSTLNMARSGRTLEMLFSAMKNSHKSIVVEGNTDNTGDAAMNTQLSLDRANAVRNYLINRGIEGSRIEALGLGSSNPKATNDTDEGRKQNRRTEVKIK